MNKEKLLEYGWKIVAQEWKEYRAMQEDSNYAYIRGMEDLLIALERSFIS